MIEDPTDEDLDSASPPAEHLLELRNLRLDDYDAVRELMDRIYPTMGAWQREQFASQIARFPEGQIAIADRGKVVAVASSVIVDYSRFGDDHTYKAITGDGYLTTHDPNGDVLYGIDVFVDPEFRGLRLGRRLYDARKEICRRLNLRAIVAGGRIPGYAEHADEMSPQEYIELVKRQEIYDPILSFQIANEFVVRRVITSYEPDDLSSHSHATLLQWDNIYYEAKKAPLIGGRKTEVRVGIVQWQMRTARRKKDLLRQVEFFVDALAGYNADFILFPEFFNGPLLGKFNKENPAEALRRLAGYSESMREAMLNMAVAYNVNIVAGSMPEYDGERLFNVSYLLRRDGTWDSQYKLHITPDEKLFWGLCGGDQLKVFETDVGKIGVLICYDVEFPELGRILSEQGMQILFVPFWTDNKNAFLRVQRCAQARAIENECYVAITGSVGNLPRVENIDIQYSQAAVFSPSDFAFPHDGIVAEATPNTEMTLICDLDLDRLKDLRLEGSVRNFADRRLDLYRVDWRGAPLSD